MRPSSTAIPGISTVSVVVLAFALCMGVAQPVHADWLTGPAAGDTEGQRDWGVELTPYGWLAGITGSVGFEPPAGAASTAVIEIGSISDTLNGAFMATLEVRWRRWRLMGDGFWARFKDTENLESPYTSATWAVSLAYGDVGFAYELPLNFGPVIDLTASARWWRPASGFSLEAEAPPGGTLGGSATVLWADVVFGLRVRHQIAEHWRVWARGDVGGGAARVDWSLEAGMGWDANRHFGLVAAYRLLGVNYQSKGFLYNMTHTGLLVGVRLAY